MDGFVPFPDMFFAILENEKFDCTGRPWHFQSFPFWDGLAMGGLPCHSVERPWARESLSTFDIHITVCIDIFNDVIWIFNGYLILDMYGMYTWSFNII